MPTEASKVVVTAGATQQACCVNHRDFPEIRAQGENPQDAANHLVNQLTRALDSALTDWRQTSVKQAIADVQAFAAEQP